MMRIGEYLARQIRGMVALGLVAAIAAGLTACEAGDRAGSRPPAANEPPALRFDCADGSRIDVGYADGGARAFVRRGDERRELPRVRSASGGKYADDSWTWWEKGGTGRLEIGGRDAGGECALSPDGN